MSWVRFTGLAVSLTVATGAVVVLPFWLTSTGCGSSSSSGITPFVPPFVAGDGGSSSATSSGGGGGSSSGASSGPASTSSSSGAVTVGSSSTTVTASSSSSSTPPCTTDTGPISGTVGPTGGSVSRLVFAVVGDTRPTNEDDPSSYPTTIITQIFKDIEGQSPHPVLTLATGDYQFSSTGSSSTASQQVPLYASATKSYSATVFPALGNHECGVSGSACSSDYNNCGPGNSGGATPNYNAFMKYLLKPIGKTNPYYSINVNATDNSWTAKFVITAANAWDSAQESWLDSTLAQATTYTFVVRHESTDASAPSCCSTCFAPGIAGVDTLLAKHPYTMLIAGHTHDYKKGIVSPDTSPTVVFGNGGAPLTSSGYDYGYGIFAQRCDGAIVVDEYDYKTNAPDTNFRFAVTPAGAYTH